MSPHKHWKNARASSLMLVGLIAGLSASIGYSQSGVAPTSATVEIADQPITIAEPTLSGQLDAEDQREKIAPYLRGLSFSQFTRDSIVAPVRINLKYIKDSSGSRVGHDVHVLFIVHEQLSTFSSESFAKTLIGDPGDADDSISQAASPKFLRSLGIEQTDENTRYRRLGFDLLDKVKLDLLSRIEHQTTDRQNRIDFSLVDAFPNRWKAIDDAGSGNPYSGLRGWLTATSMTGLDAVLIEARVVLHEPETWFRGDNFLRSKLPLVLQESARDLRRKLKKKRPAD